MSDRYSNGSRSKSSNLNSLRNDLFSNGSKGLRQLTKLLTNTYFRRSLYLVVSFGI